MWSVLRLDERIVAASGQRPNFEKNVSLCDAALRDRFFQQSTWMNQTREHHNMMSSGLGNGPPRQLSAKLNESP